MAGSYKHCVDDGGKLYVPEHLLGMLDTSSGDVYEAIEELYGMVWYLATELEQVTGDWNRQDWHTGAGFTVADKVEEAREHYTQGLKMSPGTDGVPNEFPEED